MTYAITFAAEDRLPVRRRPARTVSAQTLCGAAALTISVAVGAWGLITSRAAIDVEDGAPVLAGTARPVPPRFAMPQPGRPPLPSLGALLDPHVAAAGGRSGFMADASPLATTFSARPVVAGGPAIAAASAPMAIVVVAAADAAPPPVTAIDRDAVPVSLQLPTSVPAVVQVAEGVPMPPARPAELGPVAAADDAAPARAPTRRVTGRSRPGPEVVTAAAPDNRTFFEKLFGAPRQPSGPVLAYAAPEDGVVGALRGMASRPLSGYDSQTAVYDITAHTVYLPDGTHLEAHSGLGPMLDDPRHVSQRMRGPTPPHLYELTPREALFHGVQALRLNPVGGGGVFGRDGLLAHTFMLGPNGDSNGCVSFRNYNAFLQAFQRGQVKRLAVVTHLS